MLKRVFGKAAGKRSAAAAAVAVIAVVAALLARNQSVIRFFRHEAVISIAGDVLLDRGVANAIEQNGAPWLFEGVGRIFGRDDITVANLECPLTQARGGALKEKRFVFKADPENARALKSAGFDVMALANNHTMDYLSEGLDDTMEALGNAGLLYAGAGSSSAEIKPCFIEKNGVRIGIMSYSSLPPEGFMYDGGSATIAYARAGFLDDMKAGVACAAEQCDFLLVFFHWGTEYRHDASGAQIEIARAAVDSGASAVVGAHPHVLQGKEIYNGAPIYYSLGNFVFDKQIPDGTDETIILQITVNRSGIVDVNEIAAVINNCRPLLADTETAARIEANIIRYSRGLSDG